MNYKEIFRRKKIKDSVGELDDAYTSLNKTLNVVDLTSFGIAAIVGAGIFSTVGNAVANGGPAVSLLFLFTAFSCGLSALCYAQFASAIPFSGSAYTYAYASFGEIIAWIVGWDLFLEYAFSNIVVAISWSDYFSSFMAGFGIIIPDTFTFNSITLKLDFPAFFITLLVTYVCYIGIKESKNTNNILVLIKLLVIGLVLAVGAFYVKPENWSPFAPNGVSGVLYGISSVFFAYIGFDAISTTAEECKNPQKELPTAMLLSLVISTVIYILITLVLTGMVPYHQLGVGDPLAFVFEKINLNFLSGFISLASVITLSSVLLVYQLGQPRIWMAMSRDGLLPKIFSRIHPKFKTPSFSTLLMGIVVGLPALVADLKEVVDLTSIGTLFAFALVCGGLIVYELKGESMQSKFKLPYINSRYFLPLILLAGILVVALNWDEMEHSLERVPVYFFFVFTIILSVIAIYKELSLIPVVGLLSNLYLMSELGITNWIRFFVWLLIGLIVYFIYSYKNSKERSY